MSDKPSRLSVGRKGFIDEHGLWGEPNVTLRRRPSSAPQQKT